MPNTDRFQKVPDSFSSREEGKSAERVNTNPRYKFFKQTHFTAGDYEQFLEYWDRSTHTRSIEKKTPLVCPQLQCPLYAGLSSNDIIHTFEYIFHKYKKGIFFKIIDNGLRVFLPFSKIEYTNEWSDKIHVDPKKYKSVYDLFEKSCSQSGFTFDPNRIHYLKDHWYANNGLLRYEYPISENDSGVSTIRDMLMTLCQERQVPDGEYFINKRDFPILRKDKTEAYEYIYGENTPLVSHCYNKYCPILSMTTTDDHADIPIPTWDDWARAMYPQKIFGKDFMEYNDPYVPCYQEKIGTAIFRGASTGLGTTIEDNPRLYFSFLSQQNKCDVDGVPFLDCAITKWNCRPRKTDGMYYDTISPDLMQKLGLGPIMSMKEQATHKFILHLPGHSEAYRLSMELAMGSVILLYPCRYKLWYSSLIKPYEHYVPIDPADPEDIFHKIVWCKQHPEECETIASNARKFYEEKLSKDAILDYMQGMLQGLQDTVGKIYFPKNNMFDFQYDIEKEALDIEKKIIHSQKLFPFHGADDYAKMDLSRLHPRSFQVFLHRLDPSIIFSLIETTPVLKQSKNVVIKKITIANRVLCVKTQHTLNERNITHECFVGQVGMNKLANVCPMVLFQYGRWGDSIITDFVEGDTLEQFIYQQKSENVCHSLKLILSQISILLHYIQAEVGFIHYDLYPWNIIIHQNTENTQFSFPILNSTQTINFKPLYYPVLIDFGKSHIVYKNIHFANISPFHIHLHQDILSVLISTVFIVIQNHKVPSKDVPSLIYLINYIGQTKYTQNKRFDNITHIKNFLKIKKKYSNMLLDDKEEFKDIDPLRLFEYINLPNTFYRHKKTSWMALSLEVFYSRFMIIHELSHVFSNQKVDLYQIFKTERQPQKNPINAFFHFYIDYHLTTIMFPDKLDATFYMNKLTQYAKNVWKINDKESALVPNGDLVLPRFFSHPDVSFMDGHRSINHYYERHKVFSIITHAICHHPQLAFMSDKIKTFSHYLKPILVANKKVSISNHMSLYRESTE
jgi:tRNA A-37 threonylcarbamoyl transferase component Bud32